MAYITSAERIGRAAGLAEGLVAGIAAVLQSRFGAAGAALLPDVMQIADPERLQAMLTLAVTAATLEEIRTALDDETAGR